MKKIACALALPLFLLQACGQFHNADAGQPEVETATNASVTSIVQCLTDEAKKHDAKFKKTPDSPRHDARIRRFQRDQGSLRNGETSYRFYPGERHVSNLWLEGASKKCAPGPTAS